MYKILKAGNKKADDQFETDKSCLVRQFVKGTKAETITSKVLLNDSRTNSAATCAATFSTISKVKFFHFYSAKKKSTLNNEKKNKWKLSSVKRMHTKRP